MGFILLQRGERGGERIGQGHVGRVAAGARDLRGARHLLAAQPGKDIGIEGGGALLRSLLASEPLDKLGLMVHPVVLGRGKRLLGDGLSEGAEACGFEDVRQGVFYLTYRPESEQLQGGIPESQGGRRAVTRFDIRVSPRMQHIEIWRIK